MIARLRLKELNPLTDWETWDDPKPFICELTEGLDEDTKAKICALCANRECEPKLVPNWSF